MSKKLSNDEHSNLIFYFSYNQKIDLPNHPTNAYVQLKHMIIVNYLGSH